MQETIKISGRLACVLLLVFIAESAIAQVGPNPGEIPQLPVQSTGVATPIGPAGPSSSPSADPSDSESVRNAMDELLLARAKESISPTGDAQPANLLNSVARDIQAGSALLPIGQPSQRSTLLGADDAEKESVFSGQGYLQTIVSLLGVILLILGLGQIYKRLARSQGGLAGKLGAGGSAPAGIIEVIGRYPISKGMTLVVLRFDRRVLLLSHATSRKGKWGQSASMQMLCELGDPEDVASILLKARNADGDSIAQSFEQALREADELTDEHLRDVELGYSEVNPIRFPAARSEPARTITTQEGDRAELWSSGQESQAASGVLRRRLASMRREQG